ncbi:helix-hairpin-helix domain-containing protein [Salegentibacter sp. BLCTC]|uniref:ComEA family DNA-binding protein n=1 Tax=Salegentibacter sp. BLCTC TaxID=2697368 RepID=UPI00187BB58D|nr:helix-hairpin-helix domain-containing protein [Salegentibacter sp. BLCTC]MBE7639865.1 helix-hairpin-helix domain-containing protein [Salegentibacter sp. BLCTC]
MKPIKSHFVFSRSQQNGIFLLLCIIIILQGVYYFLNFRSDGSTEELTTEEIQDFQAQIDSLKQLQADANEVKIFPFNPNYITDFKGYTLGMSITEIDRLHRFRNKDKWINSAEDFQKVTGVSDSLLALISPYFKFPDWVVDAQKQKNNTRILPVIPISDLNEADVNELQKVSGVGEVLANRIVNYRTKIGGFRSEIQLKDIYGLNYETREKLQKQFRVSKNVNFNLININKAKVLDLVSVPYIKYELAREIIDYRQLHEGIESFAELSKIESFPSDKIDRIQLYLSLN